MRQSTILSKVGSLEAAQATTLLTSTLNGYKMEAEDATHVVDALSAVDLAAATSVEELATALQSTANSARTQGVEFDNLVGMIGAVSEATRRSASVVGNSFKTIFARLTTISAGKEIDEFGESVNDVEKVLSGLGISLRDSYMNWRDMGDVISEVAEKWDTFAGTQKSQIATSIAGVRQAETFLALMENYDRAIALADVATNSAGSSQKKFAIYLESISAKLKQLQASFEDLVYSETSQNIFKFLVDGARLLIETLDFLVNSTIGKVVLAVTSVTIAISKLQKALSVLKASKALSSIVDAAIIDGAGKLSSKLIAVAGGAYSAASAFAALWASIWPVAAAVASIGAIAYIVDKTIVTTKELKEEVDKLNQKYSEHASIISDLKNKELIDGLTKAEKNYLTVLENQNEALKDQIKEKQELAAISETRDFARTYAPQAKGKEYSQLISKMETETDVEKLSKLQSKVNELTNEFDSWMVAITKEEAATGELSDAALYLKGILEDVGYWEENLAEKTDTMSDSASTAVTDWSNFNKEIDSLQETYSTLSGAIDEYNSSGQFSLDTLQSLLALNPEYLSLLSLENGQLVLNEQAIKDKVTAQLESSKATIYNTAVSKLNALEQAAAGNASAASANQMASSIGGINANTDALARNTSEAAKNAIAKGASQGDVNKVLSDMRSQLALVDSLVGSVGTNFKTSMMGASKASGSAKSALDALNDSIKENIKLLEKQKDNYETAFNYMSSKIDEEIAKIKEQQSVEEKYWDEKINAIKEQNDAIEDQMSLQQLQDNLAKAKTKKVFRLQDGRFNYFQDDIAISDAQKALNEYLQKKAYEDEIKNLEALKKASSESFDKQIQNLEKYKKEWENISKGVKAEQDKIIAEQILGTKLDGEAWKDRISHANDYVSQYKSIVDQIAEENERLSASNASVKQQGGAGSGGGGTSKPKGYKVVGPYGELGDFPTQKEAMSFLIGFFRTAGIKDNDPRKSNYHINAYANGSKSISKDQIGLVGDNPQNREMVIPPKLNGTLMPLKKGTGIVPATMTENLMQLGRYSPIQLANNIASKVGGVSSNSYNFDKLVLPNVTDANTFVEALKNLPTLAMQSGSVRA